MRLITCDVQSKCSFRACDSDALLRIFGRAAAPPFAEHGDSQAAELQKLVRERSVEHSLDFVSQLRHWNPISKLIRDEVRSASS